MATIKINNLSLVGSEFFFDSESYLDQITELLESDVIRIKGGTHTRTQLALLAADEIQL